MRSAAGPGVPVLSRALPGTGRTPPTVESGVGTRPAGYGAVHRGHSGTCRPPYPGGTRGSCCEVARAGSTWAFGPVSRPLWSDHGFGLGGPSALEATLGPLWCAWRPGQASPKTPSRSPTPTPHRPPPYPLTRPSPAPSIGHPVAWPLATSQVGPATLLWPAHARHVQPGHPVPRVPATQPKPQAPTWRQKGPGQGGRSPSPEPSNAIGSGCLARARGLQDPGSGLSPGLPVIPDAPAQQG